MVIYDGFPIAQPHFLIIPKDHCLCFGFLSQTLLSDASAIIQTLTQKIGTEYLVFEHGDIGQTVKHAHMHVIPFAGTLESVLQKMNLVAQKQSVSSIVDLENRSQYLFIGNGKEQYVLHSVQGSVPPAVITNSVALLLGKPVPYQTREPVNPETVSRFRRMIAL